MNITIKADNFSEINDIYSIFEFHQCRCFSLNNNFSSINLDNHNYFSIKKYNLIKCYDSSLISEKLIIHYLIPSCVIFSTNSNISIKNTNFSRVENSDILKNNFAAIEIYFSNIKFYNIYINEGINQDSLSLSFFVIANSKKNDVSIFDQINYFNIFVDNRICESYLSELIFINLKYYRSSSYPLNYIFEIDGYSFEILLDNRKWDLIGSTKFSFEIYLSTVRLENNSFSNLYYYENGLINSYCSKIFIKNNLFQNITNFINSLFIFKESEELSISKSLFENLFFISYVIHIENQQKTNHSYYFADSKIFFSNQILFCEFSYQLLYYQMTIKKLVEIFPFILTMIVNSVSPKNSFDSNDENFNYYIYSSFNIFNIKGVPILNISNNIINLPEKSIFLNIENSKELIFINNFFKRFNYDNIYYNELIQLLYFSYMEKEIDNSLLYFGNKNEKILISNSGFQNFISDYGSIFYSDIKYEEKLQEFRISNCYFIDNYANFDGGVIYHSNPNNILFIENNSFYNNKAFGNGGVIYSSAEISLKNNRFINNFANKSGGVIKWIAKEPSYLETNYFNNNFAKYGNNIACDVYVLKLIRYSNEENFNFSNFKENFIKIKQDINPNIFSDNCDDCEYLSYYKKNFYSLDQNFTNSTKNLIFALFDKYYQITLIDNYLLFQLKNLNETIGIVKSTQETMMDQSGLIITDYYRISISKPNNIFDFTLESLIDFKAIEFDYSGFSIKVTKLFKKCLISENYPIAKVNLTINCLKGEIYDKENFICIPCEEDTYSLNESKINIENRICYKKSSLAYKTYASLILPLQTFWIKKNFDNIYPCQFKNSCIFTNLEENFKNNRTYYSNSFGTECYFNYTGPLCGVCNYDYDNFKNKICIKCEEFLKLSIYIFFMMIFYLMFYLYLILSSKIKDESDIDLNANLKILFNFTLIISITLKQIDNDFFSELFLYNFFEEIRFFISIQQSPLSILSFKCWIDKIVNLENYFFIRISIILIVPFIFLFVSLFIIIIWSKINKKNFKEIDLRTEIISLIHIIHYLFYYDILNALLSFLHCSKLNDEYYLKVYPLINCADNKYLLIRNLFIIPYMCFYLFLGPIINYLFLNNNQHQLENPHFKFAFGFYYINYQTKYFYWEFIIMAKKLIIIVLEMLIRVLLSYYYTKFMFYVVLIILHCIYFKIIQFKLPYKTFKLNKMELETNKLAIMILGLPVFIFILKVSDDYKNDFIMLNRIQSIKGSNIFIYPYIFILSIKFLNLLYKIILFQYFIKIKNKIYLLFFVLINKFKRPNQKKNVQFDNKVNFNYIYVKNLYAIFVKYSKNSNFDYSYNSFDVLNLLIQKKIIYYFDHQFKKNLKKISDFIEKQNQFFLLKNKIKTTKKMSITKNIQTQNKIIKNHIFFCQSILENKTLQNFFKKDNKLLNDIHNYLSILNKCLIEKK